MQLIGTVSFFCLVLGGLALIIGAKAVASRLVGAGFGLALLAPLVLCLAELVLESLGVLLRIFLPRPAVGAGYLPDRARRTALGKLFPGPKTSLKERVDRE